MFEKTLFFIMTLYILVILTGFIFLLLIWLVFGLKKKIEDKKDAEKMGALLERSTVLFEEIREMRRMMDGKLTQTHEATQRQFGQSVGLIKDITEKLTKLDETNRQVINFSSQLQNLQDILKNPKQRGVLGEFFLEETLKNVLPPNSYQMQYGFKDGSIVDAVVLVKDKLIPIDSKFSLENYEKILGASDTEEKIRLEKIFKQDLKNRIDETSRYIKPEENTVDFAFMFIPSEAIYYDLLINKIGAVQINTRSMIEYAFGEKRVVIVSPTSFLAYLQTVLQGLKAMQIEENAREIKSNVEKLGRHLATFDGYMKKLGGHMSTAVNSYNTAYKELGKIDKDVVRITEGEKRIEPLILDKPKED